MDSDIIYEKEISQSKRIAVRKFKKILLLDVREFYEKNGEKLPSKKGISLTVDQFKVILENISDIKKALNIEEDTNTQEKKLDEGQERKEVQKRTQDQEDDKRKDSEKDSETAIRKKVKTEDTTEIKFDPDH